ncbi:MAG: hypothetical protein FWH18_12570 [Marinilabiliaceae bacterium]|nr:hypothetical protein [Marinilabiliaceae bacterium]
MDDDELFRLGVCTAISNRHADIRIVGEVETGQELFDLLFDTAADIVL